MSDLVRPRDEPSAGIALEPETAWLIERADSNRPDCTAGVFLGGTGQFDGAGRFTGVLAWHNTVQWAIRFTRREDAEKFIGAMEGLSDHLPHNLTLPGLRTGDPRALTVEHSWTMKLVRP